MKPFNYAKLAHCGFVPENGHVEAGDVIIGKCMPQKQGSAIINKDTSVALKSNERGFIDRNCYGDRYFTNVTGDGYAFAKVRMRNERVPTIGDKVSSRHGQKGTIGMLYREDDMPFTSSGIVPSIIMNPHAIPSRMTIGQLMEALESKTCAAAGAMGDASPFNGRTVEDIAEELEAHGMERYGNELMYNPRTGEQVPCAIFVCPTYYQRLKHMVEDKVHCLTPDHDVLTSVGWKPIADVTVNDKVATLDCDGGLRLEYTHPLETLCFEGYTGRMYRVHRRDVDLHVTIGHRMLVTFDDAEKRDKTFVIRRASDIVGEAVSYKSDAEWEAPERPHTPDAWLVFVVFWIVRGKRHAEDDRPTDACISVGTCNMPSVRALLEALNVLGYAHAYSSSDDTIRVICARTLPPLEDGMPAWVWDLSARQAEVMLRTIVSLDDTMKYHEAGMVMRLALHAGRSAIVYPGIGGWGVEVSGYPHTRRRENIEEEEKEYEVVGDGGITVHCLTMPGKHGVFYIRRNGVPCWTGNSRAANGPVVLLTRQPAEGRARDGGLRLGEMELECMWAHGTMFFLKERFMECSDNYRVFVCRMCGMMAQVNPERGIYYCKACKNITDFAEIRIPYSCKLLMQEIQSLAIGARFITQ